MVIVAIWMHLSHIHKTSNLSAKRHIVGPPARLWDGPTHALVHPSSHLWLKPLLRWISTSPWAQAEQFTIYIFIYLLTCFHWCITRGMSYNNQKRTLYTNLYWLMIACMLDAMKIYLDVCKGIAFLVHSLLSHNTVLCVMYCCVVDHL